MNTDSTRQANAGLEESKAKCRAYYLIAVTSIVAFLLLKNHHMNNDFGQVLCRVFKISRPCLWVRKELEREETEEQREESYR